MGPGQRSLFGEQWRPGCCQQREREHVVHHHHHRRHHHHHHHHHHHDHKLSKSKVSQCKLNNLIICRYLYDFARDNKIDIWIGITENTSVSKISDGLKYELELAIVGTIIRRPQWIGWTGVQWKVTPIGLLRGMSSNQCEYYYHYNGWWWWWW